MENKATTLAPVSKEDFRANFSATAAIIRIVPEETFAATINQFKKLAIGPYFWFIADAVRGITHSAGGMVDKIIPVTEKELVNNPPEILFRHTHPDDIKQMFAFTNYWISFSLQLTPNRKKHVKCTIYLRLMNPQNLYKWVMVQYVDSITDSDGNFLFGLTLVTDVSHIKTDGEPLMSILDTYDDTGQLFYCANGNATADIKMDRPKISKREIEVLRLLAIGLSSKQIASELNIAIKTTDNHRQNLLRKTNTNSSSQLVAFGINSGFI